MYVIAKKCFDAKLKPLPDSVNISFAKKTTFASITQDGCLQNSCLFTKMLLNHVPMSKGQGLSNATILISMAQCLRIVS